MADCSQEFLKYYDSISLNQTEHDYLVAAQSAVERKIEKYFMENDQCPKVEFIGQGSFSMGTIIKPLQGDYDIDVGVYLRGYTNWQESWPKPETASQWLIKALQIHTTTSPMNKRTCIRIEYKPISGNKEVSYHVDLPIYCEYINGWGILKTRIGINGTDGGWLKSDPVGLTNWFLEKCQENRSDQNQLKRLVKYLKGWKEFKKGDAKFPSGLALTILMAKNFCPHKRDDIAFKETLRCSFNTHFCPIFCGDSISKPVEPFNNVLERLTQIQRKNFIKCFEQLVDNAIIAVKEPDKEKSLRIWKDQFDERF
jgi:hypothetical protein